MEALIFRRPFEANKAYFKIRGRGLMIIHRDIEIPELFRKFENYKKTRNANYRNCSQILSFVVAISKNAKIRNLRKYV